MDGIAANPYTPFMPTAIPSPEAPIVPRIRGKGPALLTAAVLCLNLFAGCIVSPAPSAKAAEAGPASESDAAARRKTSNTEVPSCTRVWSHAAADSVWDCPDPRPPAPVQGHPG